MKIFETLNCKIEYDALLKNHTTFGVGGKCIAIIEPNSIDEILESINICKDNNLKYFILGNGSNILVKDSGFDGIVIKLKENFNKIQLSGNQIISQSGATLREVFKFALKNSLTGFEFASGIPGTIGGAIYMNAGAYDGEMKDVVSKIKAIDIDSGKIIEISSSELNFGYRHSVIQEKNLIVVEVTINLKNGNYDDINLIFEDLDTKRNTKQPLEFKSGGSTFKRPDGYFAAKLIEDSGLKGYRVNDAMVSEKHAGFVINVGNATFRDIIDVVEHVKLTVLEKFGVQLEMEVKILGD